MPGLTTPTAPLPPEARDFFRLFAGETVYVSPEAYPAMVRYCAEFQPQVRVEAIEV